MTEIEATNYLLDRGDKYGLSLREIKEMIPLSIRDDVVKCAEFAELRDLSHDLPQSTHPELANDPSNIMFEDPSVNRSRGAVEMTDYEELVATFDNEQLAAQIDAGIHIHVDPLPMNEYPFPDLIPDFIPIYGLV